VGTQWVSNGEKKKKEKTAGFLFVKPTGSLHQVTFSPGILKKPKKPAQVLMFQNSFIGHVIWCKEHGGSKHNMKLYILDKSMLNLSQKRKALCDITHME
jgi:hypothetical protein